MYISKLRLALFVRVCFVLYASDDLYILGIDFNSGGYHVGDLNYQVLLPHSFNREEFPFESVEDSTYDADFPAVHGAGELAGHVVSRVLCVAHGQYEPVHLLFADHGRFVGFITTKEAVLKHRIGGYVWVEVLSGRVDEKHVLYHRHLAPLLSATDCQYHFRKGSEDLEPASCNS